MEGLNENLGEKFDHAKAVNNPDFRAFLVNFPDEVVSSDDGIKQAWESFTVKQELSKSLRDVYKESFKQDTGLEISDNDLAAIDAYIENQVVDDSNSETIRFLKAELKTFKELPERINEKIKTIYSISRQKAEEKKAELRTVKDLNWFKRLPLIGKYLMSDQEELALWKTTEIYGIKPKDADTEIEKIINQQISQEEAKDERKKLEDRLAELKAKIFGENFEPAKMAQEVVRAKVNDEIDRLANTADLDMENLADLKTAREQAEKGRELFERTKNVPQAGSRYEAIMTKPNFKYSDTLTPEDVQDVKNEMQEEIEDALTRQIQKIIEKMTAPRDSSYEKLRNKIKIFLEKTDVGDKKYEKAKNFIVGVLVDTHNQSPERSPQRVALNLVLKELNLFEYYNRYVNPQN